MYKFRDSTTFVHTSSLSSQPTVYRAVEFDSASVPKDTQRGSKLKDRDQPLRRDSFNNGDRLISGSGDMASLLPRDTERTVSRTSDRLLIEAASQRPLQRYTNQPGLRDSERALARDRFSQWDVDHSSERGADRLSHREEPPQRSQQDSLPVWEEPARSATQWEEPASSTQGEGPARSAAQWEEPVRSAQWDTERLAHLRAQQTQRRPDLNHASSSYRVSSANLAPTTLNGSDTAALTNSSVSAESTTNDYIRRLESLQLKLSTCKCNAFIHWLASHPVNIIKSSSPEYPYCGLVTLCIFR